MTFVRDRPSLVFAVTTALIALHTLADAFVAPEQGTVWSDHLTPGLATLAVLAVAVVGFARARAGIRAVLALLLGVLAMVGGWLAVVDARNMGLRGDDRTGILLLPAGVVLCALGLLLLWRSRRPGRFRWLRRGAMAIAAAVGVFWVVVPLAMAIVATHRPRQQVVAVSLGRPYQRVTIGTADGLRLAGWYVPSKNGAAVLSYPSRKGKLVQARMLVRHGYGVLLVDARGYDGSEGTPNMYGWGETKDIDAAVAWLRDRPDVRAGRIGGIGFSVGGEMMLEAAADNRDLRAVVSEGAGIRSYREDLLYGARGWFALPEYLVHTASLSVLSGTAPPPALDRLAARIAPRPIFLIYAEHSGGGEDLNPKFYDAAGAPKQLWRVVGAHHTGGYDADPRGYEQSVVGFFDHSLLRGGAATR